MKIMIAYSELTGSLISAMKIMIAYSELTGSLISAMKITIAYSELTGSLISAMKIMIAYSELTGRPVKTLEHTSVVCAFTRHSELLTSVCNDATVLEDHVAPGVY
jgi:hypothetical protein